MKRTPPGEEFTFPSPQIDEYVKMYSRQFQEETYPQEIETEEGDENIICSDYSVTQNGKEYQVCVVREISTDKMLGSHCTCTGFALLKSCVHVTHCFLAPYPKSKKEYMTSQKE